MGVGHRASNPIPEKTYSTMKSDSSIASWIFGKRTTQEIFHKLQNEETLVGLNVNEDKTKYVQIKNRNKRHNT